MKAYEYHIEHFTLMAQVAAWLPRIDVQLWEHSYAYYSFGSWWFTFMKSDQIYRVVYDGKEYELRLELGKCYIDKKWVDAWELIESIRFRESPTGVDLQAICDLLERNIIP